MMTYARPHSTPRHPGSSREAVRRAFVVHDGWAFELAQAMRELGVEVAEGPLLSFANGFDESALAVIATRPGVTRRERLRDWTRDLCWRGMGLVAVGSAVRPVAEFFGQTPDEVGPRRSTSRLVHATVRSAGLFSGLPSDVRVALPEGERLDAAELTAEFAATAWAKDGELLGASHVFRPVHLLHAGMIESPPLRAVVARNIVRLLRNTGGRVL